MLDIKLIRKNHAAILEKIRRKEPTLDLGDVLMLDEKVRALKINRYTISKRFKTNNF